MASYQLEETCENENCENAVCKFEHAPSLPPLIPDERWLCSGCTLELQQNSVKALCTESKVEDEVVEQFKKKAPRVIGSMMKSHLPKDRVGPKGEEIVGIFEPTNGDIRLVGRLAPDLFFLLRKCSLRQFHEILFPKQFGSGKDLRGTLFEVFEKDEKNLTEFKDLTKRAKKLVEVVDNNVDKVEKVKKVYLLDGHGRTLLAIINAMIEKKLDPSSVTFVVVDFDKECHRFHKHFFPKLVDSKCMNILDIDLRKNELAYLNFCSIPSRVDNIHFNKEEVLKWMWDKLQKMECRIMISTAIRDARKEKEKANNIKTAPGPRTGKNTKDCHLIPAGFKFYLKDKDFFQAEQVSIRDEGTACEFGTWLICPKNCKAKESPDKLKERFEQDCITWDYKLDIGENTKVRMLDGKHKGTTFVVIQRTPCQVALYDPETREKKIIWVDIKSVEKVEKIEEDFKNLGIN